MAEGQLQGVAATVRFPPFDVVVESPTTILVADNEGRRVVRYDVSSESIVTVVD
jgi:hypothetical protein